MRTLLTPFAILTMLLAGVPAAFASGDIEAPDTIQTNKGPGNMDVPSKKVDKVATPTPTPHPTPTPKAAEKKKSAY